MQLNGAAVRRGMHARTSKETAPDPSSHTVFTFTCTVRALRSPQYHRIQNCWVY